MPDTTPVPSTDGPEATESTQDDESWAMRYKGAQRVIASRDEALHSAQAALDSLRAEKEAADLELAEYRQTTVDAQEEAAALAQYEQLAARFDTRPPEPISNTAPRPHWTDSTFDPDEKLEDISDGGSGWPT